MSKNRSKFERNFALFSFVSPPSIRQTILSADKPLHKKIAPTFKNNTVRGLFGSTEPVHMISISQGRARAVESLRVRVWASSGANNREKRLLSNWNEQRFVVSFYLSSSARSFTELLSGAACHAKSNKAPRINGKVTSCVLCPDRKTCFFFLLQWNHKRPECIKWQQKLIEKITTAAKTNNWVCFNILRSWEI